MFATAKVGAPKRCTCDRLFAPWNGELKPGPLEVGFDSFFGLPTVNSHAPFVLVENHRVLGLDPARNPLAVKRHVGYLPDNVGFYGSMSGRENLRYTARLNGIEPKAATARIDHLLGGVIGAARQHLVAWHPHVTPRRALGFFLDEKRRERDRALVGGARAPTQS